MNVAQYLVPVVRRLPHWRVSLPLVRDPGITLTFDLDTDLGLWLGHSESGLVEQWKELVSPNDVVYDIGAHIGVYSLLAANLGAQVHAFEPNQSAVRRFRQSIAKNRFDGQIVVNETAVSNVVGDVEFYMQQADRQHSLVTPSGDATTVPSTTIDEYANDIPDVVKVDVEGAAGRVLKGATSTISRQTTAWIIEVHNEDEKEAIHQTFPAEEYSIKQMGAHRKIAPIDQ